MGKLKYIARLTAKERAELLELVNKGQAAAQKIKHANVLLKIDANGPNWSDQQAAEAFGCSERTVFTIRQRLVDQGLEAALNRKKRERPPIEPILDEKKEARLLEIASSPPPKGHSRWSLALLAERLIELKVVEQISPQTVMRALKRVEGG